MAILISFLIFIPSISAEGIDNDTLMTYGADADVISESGRSPGEGDGNPLQYSCLKNPMGRGHWRATVHGVTKGRT